MYDKLIGAIKEQQNLVARSVLERPQPDHASYMKQVGIFEGLKTALDLINKQIREDIVR